MSKPGRGAGAGQSSRKSISRRITAHQIGEQISLLLLFNLIVLSAVAFFLAHRLCAASVVLNSAAQTAVIGIGTPAAPGGIDAGSPAFSADSDADDFTPPADADSVDLSLPVETGADISERMYDTGDAETAPPIGPDGGDAAPDIRLKPYVCIQVPNILYDDYKISGGVETPPGARVKKSFAPLFGLPEGAFFDFRFSPISDVSIVRPWADMRSVITLPLPDGNGGDGAPLYNQIIFTHTSLFFILFRAVAVLLIIQAFIILRRSLRTGRHTRRILRPITELTMAAQNINAAQAAHAASGLGGGQSPYGGGSGGYAAGGGGHGLHGQWHGRQHLFRRGQLSAVQLAAPPPM